MKNKSQEWFEMPEIRRRFFNKSSWIPLKESCVILEEGESGCVGYIEEYFGVNSIIVPISKKSEAEKIRWTDTNTGGSASGYVEDGKYIPAYMFKNYKSDILAEQLVVEGEGSSIECSEWHINTDLVVTLGLKREGDVWLSMSRGYEEVIKLKRDENGCPNSILIKASYLKDYLCARDMALYITSYRSRSQVVEKASHLNWPDPFTEKKEMDRWEGRITEMHEGGHPFGSGFAVMHVSRTDVDFDEDVPELDFADDKSTSFKRHEGRFKGRKIFRIHGELWRNEWVEPAENSPIVLGHNVASTSSFITDNSGKLESGDSLDNGVSRWLWFDPSVINNILKIRGSFLVWYTRDTGSIGISPGNGLHFGVNKIGLINIYAKDIGLLPNWQQKIWAGHNVVPDGKVSSELLMSQMKAKPATTNAPESDIQKGIVSVNHLFQKKYNAQLIKEHSQEKTLIDNVHRFRAFDTDGLLALAKDLHKLIGERINTIEIKRILQLKKKDSLGSLKALEQLMASEVGDEKARKLVGPLHGVYALRILDAHLSSKKLSEAFELCGINNSDPVIIQGQQLIQSVILCLVQICVILDKP